MSNDVPELGRVLRLLDSVRRQRQAAHVIAGICAFLAWGSAVTLALVLAAVWFPLPAWVRWGMLAAWAVWLLVSGVQLIFVRLIWNPTDEEIALLVEDAYPAMHNEIINAVRFLEESPAPKQAFIRAAIRESDRQAAQLDAGRVVSWHDTRRNATAFAVVLLAWVVMMIGFRPRTLNAMSRIVRPAANLAQVGRVRILEVIPGDVAVVAGDSLVVEAVLDAGGDAPAMRVQHFVKGGPVHEQKMRRVDESRFRCELLDIKTPRTYRVAAGRSRSRNFHIRVTARPLVSKVAVQYLYPDYTGLAPKTEEDCAGIVRAVKGSSAELRIVSNKPLKSAVLDLGQDNRSSMWLEPGRTTATTRSALKITENISGRIEIEDEDHCRNARPLRIVAQRDHPPKVKIVAPASDRTLAVGESLEIEVRGSDDFGVTRAELIEKRLAASSGNLGEPTVVHQWAGLGGARNVACRWTWQFERRSYRNGETVRYFVRMQDANDVDGPGRGTSAEFVVRLEDVATRRKERERDYRHWQTELEKLLREQEDVRRESDGLKSGKPE